MHILHRRSTIDHTNFVAGYVDGKNGCVTQRIGIYFRVFAIFMRYRGSSGIHWLLVFRMFGHSCKISSQLQSHVWIGPLCLSSRFAQGDPSLSAHLYSISTLNTGFYMKVNEASQSSSLQPSHTCYCTLWSCSKYRDSPMWCYPLHNAWSNKLYIIEYLQVQYALASGWFADSRLPRSIMMALKDCKSCSP